MSPVEESRQGPAEWVQTALVGIGVATVVIDGRGDILVMSPVAETLTGWSQDEAVGRPLAAVFRIVSEEARLPVADPVSAVLASGSAVALADHTVLIARDGREARI